MLECTTFTPSPSRDYRAFLAPRPHQFYNMCTPPLGNEPLTFFHRRKRATFWLREISVIILTFLKSHECFHQSIRFYSLISRPRDVKLNALKYLLKSPRNQKARYLTYLEPVRFQDPSLTRLLVRIRTYYLRILSTRLTRRARTSTKTNIPPWKTCWPRVKGSLHAFFEWINQIILYCKTSRNLPLPQIRVKKVFCILMFLRTSLTTSISILKISTQSKFFYKPCVLQHKHPHNQYNQRLFSYINRFSS